MFEIEDHGDILCELASRGSEEDPCLERYNMEVYEPNIRRAKGLGTKNSKIRVLIYFAQNFRANARNFRAYTRNFPEKQIETLTFDF